MRRLLLAMMAVALWSRSAHADAPKRPLPDYDGRPDAPRNGEIAAWPARVVLFPLYLGAEFLLRQPIGFAVRAAGDPKQEEETMLRREGPWGGRPILVLDYGFKPRVGLEVTHIVDTSVLRMHLEAWGFTSYAAGVGVGRAIGEGVTIDVHGDLSRRPDTIFHGIGPRSSPDDRQRIDIERGEAGATFVARPDVRVALTTGFGVHGVAFRTPISFANDYVAVTQTFSIAVDAMHDRTDRGVGKKNPRVIRTDGVRAEAFAEPVAILPRAQSLLSWGGTFRGAIDLDGHTRILELATMARFVDPLGNSDAPPFTELVSLGGDAYLRGHLAGRVVGRSALTVSAQYSWPVWVWVDGVARVEAGNVFDAHLANIAPGLFRLSATLGVQNTGASDYRFEMLAGIGTEPFDQGANITSIRLLLAARRW